MAGSVGITSEERALVEQLGRARAEAIEPLSADEVARLLREVLATLEGDLNAGDLKVYAELEGLAQYIQAARSEIAAIRPDDITTDQIPLATDELDAVVGSTEEATHAIMDACDVIAGVAGRVGPDEAAILTDSVTRIFEACNFQDITGQRITKVVRALKYIEGKIGALVAAFGDGATLGSGRSTLHPKPQAAPPASTPDTDRDLMHGPSMPGAGIDQSEIDRLLASFD